MIGKFYLVFDGSKASPVYIPVGSDESYYAAVGESFSKKDYTDFLQLNECDKVGGVYFNWGLAGPDGAWFDLYRFPHHIKRHLDMAKTELRNSRDVVHMSVSRIKKWVDWEQPRSPKTYSSDYVFIDRGSVWIHLDDVDEYLEKMDICQIP